MKNRAEKPEDMGRRHILASAVSMAGVGMLSSHMGIALAQSYPDKPIKIVVPGPPSGGTDFLTRLVADYLAKDLNQTVMVENKAGASGLIGTKYVRQQRADGYTFVMGFTGTHAILPLIYSQPPYDPVNDFTPISLVATAPEILVVPSSSKIVSVADYVALARAEPGSVSYGTPGIGQTQHILGQQFSEQADIKLLHVPYNGSGPALTDLVGGRITSMFVTPSAVMPFMRDGRIRALAVSSGERYKLLPDVPTLEESGITGIRQTSWFGLFAPAGLADDRKQIIEQAVMRVLRDPSARETIVSNFVEPRGTTASDLAAFQNEEIKRYTTIVKRMDIRLG